MSSVTGHAQGIGAAHASARSEPVYTATTPGRDVASDTSIEMIRAWAYGLRATARCSAPGIARSLVNLVSPVSSAGSSRRSIRCPMNGAGAVSVVVIVGVRSDTRDEAPARERPDANCVAG